MQGWPQRPQPHPPMDLRRASGRAGPAVAAVVALTACLVAASLGAAAAARQAPRPRVAAAADLNVALPEIAAAFERETGQALDLVFGSSGTLARQISDGAPFELFLSADEQFVARLAASGHTDGDGVLYAVGRLVLFAPTGSPFDPATGFDGLARLVARGAVRRFAIANPAHAPYGRAAEAALRTHGLWTDLQPRLVLGENVAQAAQFATTGNAAGGLIAYALALSPNLRRLGTFALVPESDHLPLRQRMALLTRAGPVARRFYAYLQTPAARAILDRHGFTLPK